MTFSPLNNLELVDSVLFIDEKTSKMVSLLHNIEDLVPSHFKMISSLDFPKETLSSNMDNILSATGVKNINIFISSNINDFLEQIEFLINFKECSLQNIYTTSKVFSNTIPNNIKSIIRYVENFVLPISNKFFLINGYDNILKDQLNENFSRVSNISQTIKSVIDSRDGFKCFFVGTYSSKIASLINNPNSKTAAIIIDRVKFAAPIYALSDCLLDFINVKNSVDMLEMSNLIQINMSSNSNDLVKEVAKFVGIDGNIQGLQGLFNRFGNISSDKKQVVKNLFPMLFDTLSNVSLLQRKNNQESLVQGSDILDILGMSNFRDSISLIGFYAMFKKEKNIMNLLAEAAQNDPDGETKYQPISMINNYINISESGVTGNIKSSRHIYGLIDLVSDVICGGVDSTLNSASNESFDIDLFDSVNIFVLGGLSFYEMKEINDILKMSKKSVRIFTDAFTSSQDPFLR